MAIHEAPPKKLPTPSDVKGSPVSSGISFYALRKALERIASLGKDGGDDHNQRGTHPRAPAGGGS
jgi:hypothetical protein